MFARIGVAVVAIAVGLVELHGASEGLRIVHTKVAKTPVTIFQPEAMTRAPVILIAHGFAGSQQLMQSFALTLARNGYTAVTFDFPGHDAIPRRSQAASPKRAARRARSQMN